MLRFAPNLHTVHAVLFVHYEHVDKQDSHAVSLSKVPDLHTHEEFDTIKFRSV